MKFFYWCLALAWLALFGLATFVALKDPCVIESYEKNARTPIFTAFVTLGSFLLTLKTTILQRLKDGFDCEEHKENYLYASANGGKDGYYHSLCNMSQALALTVVLALLSSACQMTLGFLATPITFGICASLPMATLGVLLFLWWQITGAHQLWLKSIEEKKQQELKKEQKI